MNRLLPVLATCLLAFVPVRAGEGFKMKCEAQPEKNATPSEVSKPCGFEAHVTFGGGMFFGQVMGYCRTCKKFVYLRWTHDGAPPEIVKEPKPRPRPIGEVWDAQTGKASAVYACPTCKGPFLEIKGPDELKHCPACNQPHFVIDKSQPQVIVD